MGTRWTYTDLENIKYRNGFVSQSLEFRKTKIPL
jgi:hypothetical protein